MNNKGLRTHSPISVNDDEILGLTNDLPNVSDAAMQGGINVKPIAFITNRL
ncbi:MAG: hypothetical protein MET45_05050 [Nostoc sp. LLA-1]|nr:hypothetical protein [Cyanocohniella sp. LLY]